MWYLHSWSGTVFSNVKTSHWDDTDIPLFLLFFSFSSSSSSFFVRTFFYIWTTATCFVSLFNIRIIYGQPMIFLLVHYLILCAHSMCTLHNIIGSFLLKSLLSIMKKKKVFFWFYRFMMTEFFPPETLGFTTATRNGYHKVLRDQHSPDKNILTHPTVLRVSRIYMFLKPGCFLKKYCHKTYDINNITWFEQERIWPLLIN